MVMSEGTHSISEYFSLPNPQASVERIRSARDKRGRKIQHWGLNCRRAYYIFHQQSRLYTMVLVLIIVVLCTAAGRK